MFLGRTPEANVFLAELTGLYMALDIAKQQTKKEVTIFSDSQAAIQAIDGAQGKGQ